MLAVFLHGCLGFCGCSCA